MFWFHYLVAGAGHLIWHWGTGIGLIAICLLCAYGTVAINAIPLVGPFLARVFAPLRKDFLIAAALVALFLAGMYVGKRDTDLQYAKRTEIITNRVDVIVKGTTPRPNAKHKAPRDRWDNPKN